jgi:hypothetical protein
VTTQTRPVDDACQARRVSVPGSPHCARVVDVQPRCPSLFKAGLDLDGRSGSDRGQYAAYWTMIIAMTCRLACTPGRTGTAAESQDLKSIRWAK